MLSLRLRNACPHGVSVNVTCYLQAAVVTPAVRRKSEEVVVLPQSQPRDRNTGPETPPTLCGVVTLHQSEQRSEHNKCTNKRTR